nr:hypothetical protein OG461_05895 [Streptomyces sp. NBC_00995]
MSIELVVGCRSVLDGGLPMEPLAVDLRNVGLQDIAQVIIACRHFQP